MNRCEWPGADNLMIAYHDEEWGVPLLDDQKWFEFMVLDTFQAGLSWKIILHKREGFREVFFNFEVEKVAQISDEQIDQIRLLKSIVTNKLKIKSTVSNAQAFIHIKQEFGSFNKYIWDFVGRKPIVNHFETMSGIPSKTELSDALSKDLYARGFKFVGSTICYAFMQASGIVNDHIIGCFRHQEIIDNY